MKWEEKSNRIKIVTIIAFLLSIGPLTWIVYGNEEKNIAYSIKEELIEESTKARLTLEVTPSDKVVEVCKIVLPDGSIVERQTSIEYEVKENREYKFVIQYKILKEDEGEVEKEEIITYQEENILEKQEEPKGDDQPSEEVPSAIVEESKEEDSNTAINTPEVYAVGDIAINETNFPDESFRNWVLNQSYGTDKILTSEEIAKVTTINVNTKDISSVKGIEYFTALEIFLCDNNRLTALDLSNNKLLTKINCSMNEIAFLNISECRNLQVLYCNNNNLQTLNVSNNTQLSTFNCSVNQLTYIDLSKNMALTSAPLGSQNVNISMCFNEGFWRSNTDVKYVFTSIHNSNITYDSALGQLLVSSTDISSTPFQTIVTDGQGKEHGVGGTIYFTYKEFIPVTDITDIPANIFAGATVNLNGTVVPSNANEKNITWSIKNVGTTGAILTDNTLLTTSSGTIELIATIPWGLKENAFVQYFTIHVTYANPDNLLCDLKGEKGKNGWYTSDVIVSPPSGYQISKTLGKEYTTTLNYSTVVTPTVYLKNSNTGILYSAKILNEIKIDNNDPVISGIIHEGSAIATTRTFEVEDENLNSVMLYSANTLEELRTAKGTALTVTNKKCESTLTITDKDQFFKIEAEDLSGRRIIYIYRLILPTYGIEVEDIIFEAVDFGYQEIEGKKIKIDLNKGNSTATIVAIISNDESKFVVEKKGNDWIVKPIMGLAEGKHQVKLIITYNSGNVTSSVSMVVRQINPSVFVSIPTDIKLEKVRNDEMFEAITEEEVSILSTTDTTVFTENFYIQTDPSFHLINTTNSDEWFTVQIYDEGNNKHTKDTPLAILNSTTRKKSFFVKVLKDITREKGIYEGTMNFIIGYGEEK